MVGASLTRDLVASIDAVVEQKVLAFVIIEGAEWTERQCRSHRKH